MVHTIRMRWLLLIIATLLASTLIAQPMLRWQEGVAYSYTLTLQTRQQVSFEQVARLIDDAPTNASRPDYIYDYELRASLLIAPLQRIEQDWLLVWKFESPRLALRAGEGTPQPMDTRPLQQQIEKVTLFVRLSPSGEIRALWFAPPDAVDAHDLLRAVVARLQIRLPDRATMQWMSEEESPEGRYRAQYNLVQRNEKRYRIQKRRVNYTETTTSLPLPQTLKPSDKISIELRDSFLHHIEGRMVTESFAGEKRLGSEVTTLRLWWRETRPIEAARLQAWRTRYRPIAGKPESLRVPDRAPTLEQQRLADQQILGNETLETLQRKLAQLPVDAPFEQVAALMPPWTALVRLQPQLSGRLVLQIAALDIRSPQAQVLITALREAGHAPAQAALAQLARLYYYRRDADTYALLIPNFALLNAPTEATEAALQELAQADEPAFANPARLALGSIGNSLRETEPARARRLGAWIIRQLELTTNDSEREVWLLALGNLGLNDTLPTIQAYLNSPNENLRTAATGALRFLTLSGTESLLLERLRTDNSRLVKQEAISAFQYRTPSSAALQLLREYLQQETDKQLRRALLDSLYTQATKNSAIVELLRWAAQNDADQEIRLYAESLVVSLK